MTQREIDLRAKRRALRQVLKLQGFDRTHYSGDVDGTGQYRETWAHPLLGEVRIEWGPRTAVTP